MRALVTLTALLLSSAAFANPSVCDVGAKTLATCGIIAGFPTANGYPNALVICADQNTKSIKIDIEKGASITGDLVDQSSTDPNTVIYTVAKRTDEMTISLTTQAGQQYAYLSAKLDGQTEFSNLGILSCHP